jgi:pimeloyl-ACP methyl ester carboxylesterase
VLKTCVILYSIAICFLPKDALASIKPEEEHFKESTLLQSDEFQVPSGLKPATADEGCTYFFDKNSTRYQLVAGQHKKEAVNWLFLPGGPGVDSECMLELTKHLRIPGNCWLIDLPFNGTNQPYEFTSNKVYEHWPDYLVSAVKNFKNPILVGHSFGGFFPLFVPELEDLLKGFVILNSVPTMDSHLFAQCSKDKDLPPLDSYRSAFVNTPTIDTLKALYRAEAPYFFAPEDMAKGIDTIIDRLVYCLPTEHWFYTEGATVFKTIRWVPQKVPTLILGGENDCITPLEIFIQDKRFDRDNIEICNIPNAGHFPWLEEPQVMNIKFAAFAREIIR